MVDRGWLIIFGVLLFVGLLNFGLMLSALRNRERREPYLRDSLSELLNPWKKENEALDQLHREVEKLGENPGNDNSDKPER
jgi:uncharacterized protein YlxW (UPF0749 family)